MQILPNFHVIKVSFGSATNTTGARILMRSERFKQTKTIGYDYNYNNTLDGARAYLESKGFEFTGAAEGKDCYYLISTVFNKIK